MRLVCCGWYVCKKKNELRCNRDELSVLLALPSATHLGEMASSSKVRLCFATNQNHREVKPAVVDKLEFDVILKAGSSKLRVKAKRLFTPEGVEITPENVASFHVRCSLSHLVLLEGPNSHGRRS